MTARAQTWLPAQVGLGLIPACVGSETRSLSTNRAIGADGNGGPQPGHQRRADGNNAHSARAFLGAPTRLSGNRMTPQFRRSRSTATSGTPLTCPAATARSSAA